MHYSLFNPPRQTCWVPLENEAMKCCLEEQLNQLKPPCRGSSLSPTYAYCHHHPTPLTLHPQAFAHFAVPPTTEPARPDVLTKRHAQTIATCYRNDMHTIAYKIVASRHIKNLSGERTITDTHTYMHRYRDFSHTTH